MQYSRLLQASVCSAALLFAAPAFAFGNGHSGGFSGGHSGGFSGARAGGAGNFSGGYSGAHMSFATGGPHNGYAGAYRRGGGWGPGYGYGWGVGAPYAYGYDYGYDDPYDDGYAYDTPDYDYSYDDNGYGPGVYAQGDQGAGPYTPGPEAATGPGNYCRTPVKVCQLYQPANVGADCSCRDGAGRAYGQVSP
jgi:hypothetical protein